MQAIRKISDLEPLVGTFTDVLFAEAEFVTHHYNLTIAHPTLRLGVIVPFLDSSSGFDIHHELKVFDPPYTNTNNYLVGFDDLLLTDDDEQFVLYMQLCMLINDNYNMGRDFISPDIDFTDFADGRFFDAVEKLDRKLHVGHRWVLSYYRHHSLTVSDFAHDFSSDGFYEAFVNAGVHGYLGSSAEFQKLRKMFKSKKRTMI